MLELHVYNDLAFYVETGGITRDEPVVIKYANAPGCAMRVRGNDYPFENGVCRIPHESLANGTNGCLLITPRGKIVAEGLVKKAGFVVPAGITNKAAVKRLIRQATDAEEDAKRSHSRIAELIKYAPDDNDIFNI